MAEPPLIEVRKVKDVNLKGGIVLDGFPSVGLANAIASECLIHSLRTELVAVLDSPAFPPLSVVRNSVPNFPARVYANEELGLAVFVSELNIDPVMYRAVAKTMLQWARESGCELVVSAAGMPYDDSGNDADSDNGDGGNSSGGRDGAGIAGSSNSNNSPADSTEEAYKLDQSPPQVYAVASTPNALHRAAQAGMVRLGGGSIAGIPAILLNEGVWSGLDVIVLLVKVLKDAPDFRAGAALVEAISRIAPGISCDVGSLLKEAKAMETTLKKLRSNQQAAGPVRKQEMYG